MSVLSMYSANKFSAMSSVPFAFVVGIHQKRFYIHSAAVERLSKPLHALVNCGMKESVDRSVVWDDIDEQTFLAFAEFVYTGDYSAPKPEELSSEDHSNKDVRMDYESERRKRQKLSNPPPQPSALHQKFKSSDKYNYPGKGGPSSRIDGLPRENFTPVFLAHAKLFELADRYNVGLLAQLSLHKLHRTLCGFTLSDGGNSHIWNLVRHCYESPQPQALRDLVAFYIAAKPRDLWKVDETRLLANDFPEFAADMLEVCMRD